MRPNRIGAWPYALNNATDGTASNALIPAATTQATLEAWRTPYDVIELVPGVSGYFHDTVYSQDIQYAGTTEVSLTVDMPRISFGGYIRPQGFRTDVLQPFYVRMKGNAHVKLGDNGFVFLQPVFGIKGTPSTPTQVTTALGKTNRRMNVVRHLPTDLHGHERLGSSEVTLASIDTTFIVAATFGRFGGVGYNPDTIFGAGWSVYMPGRATGASVNLQADLSFSMSCWIYSADLDVYDPNKS